MKRQYFALAVLVALLAPAPALAEFNVRLGLNTTWLTGKDFDLIAEQDAYTGYELGVGLEVIDGLAVDLGYQFNRNELDSYNDSALFSLAVHQINASARYRWQALDWLGLYGRAGITGGYGSLDYLRFDEDDLPAITGNSFTIGGHALGGIEFVISRPWMRGQQGNPAPGSQDPVFTCGAYLEAGYSLMSALDFNGSQAIAHPNEEIAKKQIAPQAVDLGTLTLSGPVLRAGIVFYW